MRTFKRIAILMIAVMTTSLAFGQMKNQPKTVVIFLGPMNSTFNEADFPNLNFYYTPDLVLKISKRASENVNKKAWSSAIGFGRTAGAEDKDVYTGLPQEIVDNSISSGEAYLFDSEGLINAKTFSGKDADFAKSTQFLVKFNNLKRSWEAESFDNLMKTIVKKGSALQKTKKPKKEKKNAQRYDFGKDFDDFKVVDKDGNAYGMHSLTKGNTATLVLFLRVNSEYDLNKGKESGEGKKGKDFMNQVAQTVAAEKQIAPLYNLEKGIYGNKIKR